MAYFNHSFCKSWLAVGAAPANAPNSTANLTAGQMALVDGTTYLVDTQEMLPLMVDHFQDFVA